MIVPMIVATVVAVVALWPQESTPTDPSGLTVSRCGTFTVRITEGPEAGRTVQTQVPNGPGAPRVDIGDDVVVFVLSDPADPSSQQYVITDHQRGVPQAGSRCWSPSR